MNYTDTVAARVAPSSDPAEVSVLGSILLDPDVITAGQVAGLTATDFYGHRHQIIWRAMQALHAAGEPAGDLTLLHGYLSRTGQLDEAGGLTYLVGLSDQTPTAAHAEHYALIVREHAHRRALIRHASDVQRHVYAGDMPLEDLQTLATTPPALELGQDDGLVHLADALADVLAQAENGTGTRGAPTGLNDLTDAVNGLEAGRLYVLAARPAMGKSALAFQVAAHIAQTTGRVLGFSLEMPASEISARILASEARVGLERFTKARRGDPGALNTRDRENLRAASTRLASARLDILPKPGLRLHELMDEVRKAHAAEPLALFVLDYIQLVQLSGRGGDNANARITEITTALKRLALELDIPVLALSQLSRNVESRGDRRPTLSDLRDSGSIEQDADVVLFIYRDEYYNPQTDQQGVAEIIIGKNRNGPAGTIKAAFQAAYVRFNDLAYS